MLHILWVILKIILIIIAVLLGILLLVSMLVLFCPIRYRGEGRKQEKELNGKIRVSWLFRIFAYTIEYKEGKMHQVLRIFGIPVQAYQSLAKRIGASLHKMRRQKRSKKLPDIERENTEQENTERENTEPLLVEEHEVRSVPYKETAKRVEVFRKIFEIFRSILRIPSKIRKGIGKIALSFRRFCANMEKWKLFFEDERTRGGLTLGWEECKKLLRHLGPTKISGSLTFGMEDPSVTGQVLGIFGMTLPLHKNMLKIVPVFGENILEGNVWLKGRIYVFVLLKTAIKLYLDKNIKFMMNAMKKEG